MLIYDTDSLEKIGRRFTEFRMAIGRGQAELAEELGITPALLSAIERGETEPPLAGLYYLNQKYHLNFNWLITGEENLFLDRGDQQGDEAEVREKERQYRELLALMDIPVVKNAIDAALTEILALMNIKGEPDLNSGVHPNASDGKEGGAPRQ